jgi:hypothetical protein
MEGQQSRHPVKKKHFSRCMDISSEKQTIVDHLMMFHNVNSRERSHAILDLKQYTEFLVK